MVSSTGSSTALYHTSDNSSKDANTVIVDDHILKMPFTPGEDEPSWANAWRQAVLDVSFFSFQTIDHLCTRLHFFCHNYPHSLM